MTKMNGKHVFPITPYQKINKYTTDQNKINTKVTH